MICNVTEAVAVVAFPEASVAVTVTVFAPRSEQPKLLGETLNVTLEQLSVAELTSCAVDKLAEPLASSTRVTGAVDNAAKVLCCLVPQQS